MKNFNDLVMGYYAAVDSGNKSLAEKLLGEILLLVRNDGRVLAEIRKCGIGYHGGEEVLAIINEVIWKTSRQPEKRWDLSKGGGFMTWVVSIAKRKAIDVLRKERRHKHKGYLDKNDNERSMTYVRPRGKVVNQWGEMISSKAWDGLSAERKYILTMERNDEKGKKIAKDLGWHPSKVTKEKNKAIKLLRDSSDELGSFNGGCFYKKLFVGVSIQVQSN